MPEDKEKKSYPTFSPEKLERFATKMRAAMVEMVGELLGRLDDQYGQAAEGWENIGDLNLERLRDRLKIVLAGVKGHPPEEMAKSDQEIKVFREFYQHLTERDETIAEMSLAQRMEAFNEFYHILLDPFISPLNVTYNEIGNVQTQLGKDQSKEIKLLPVSEEFIRILEDIIPIPTYFANEITELDKKGPYTETVWIATLLRNQVIALNIVKRNQLVYHIQPWRVWSKELPHFPLSLRTSVSDDQAEVTIVDGSLDIAPNHLNVMGRLWRVIMDRIKGLKSDG